MPIPRKQLIDLDSTLYYHCISRCVQQCFLLGKHKDADKSYSHRKAWIESRLLKQSKAFSIQICAFAVMSNHLHVVLYVDKHKVKDWTLFDICSRWGQIANLPAVVLRYLNKQQLGDDEMQTVQVFARTYRKRLQSISCFMGMLNWHIARRANKEEGRKGHFWEGRFRSHALLNDAALMSCMAYVDLNPIRAKTTDNLHDSEYTSIYHRLAHKKRNKQPNYLKPFGRNASESGLPCSFSSYLSIVSNLVKQSNPGIQHKRNSMDTYLLTKFGLTELQLSTITSKFESLFDYAAGAESLLVYFKQKMGRKKIRGRKNAQALFGYT